MLVTNANLGEVCERFIKPGQYALDTETTGLDETARIFSLIITDEFDSYYFNFQEYDDVEPKYVLDREQVWKLLEPAFDEDHSIWFIHNAKFDMRMLGYDGVKIKGTVHCTQAIERVVKNNHIDGYSLAACGKRLGYDKDDAVERYISKHRLYENKSIPGKKKLWKDKFYWKVPFDIVAPYGEKDGLVCRRLGLQQLSKIPPDLASLVDNERKLTKTCFAMERVGIKIDPHYCDLALSQELATMERLKKEFKNLTDVEFLDSPLTLTEAFTKLGESFPRTAKGNPSFRRDVLVTMSTPAASLVNKIRHAEKYANTYYSSFLHIADADNVIHPSMNPAGTETGRFSYYEPNLQNVPKEDEGEHRFYVRKCFVPRKDFCFVMIDYDQQEFRLMLDYAGEKELIEEINNGADVHQATANMVGVSRKEAKTLNFALLYGMGIKKLSERMGISLEEARTLREKYFARLPKVQKFIKDVMDGGAYYGFVFNWFGRRCHIHEPDEAYKLPNHLIQGGCADVMKIGMNRIHDFLASYKSRMLVSVHDELVFEIHKTELDVVPSLKEIMEEVYPAKNGMKLTCSVEHSWKSWGHCDKVEGMPQ